MGWPAVIHFSSDSVKIDRIFKTPRLGHKRLNLYSDFFVQYKLVSLETCKDNKSVLVENYDCHPYLSQDHHCSEVQWEG